MLAGRMQGSNSKALWVIDSANQQMIALTWDRSRGALQLVGFRDLAADAQEVGDGR